MPGNGLIRSIQRLIDSEQQLEDQSPFDRLRLQMTEVMGDGGILKEVVKPGVGAPVPNHASVLMYYSGFLEYADEPFETNTNFKFPRMMKLGRDVTLSGLVLGLLTMKKGEFSRFLFSPQYAFGDIGCPPRIPAASVVLYEVEVLDFLDSGQVDDFTTLSPEDQNAAPLSTLVKVVNTLRCFGNRCFRRGHFYSAKDHYKQAVMLLGNREVQSDLEKQSVRAAELPLLLNLSFSELRLDSPHKALKYGKKALEIDSGNTKAHFRCAQAYLELQEYESAQHCLLCAQAKKPFDSDISSLLTKVALYNRDNLDKEKDMCSKMFSGMRG